MKYFKSILFARILHSEEREPAIDGQSRVGPLPDIPPPVRWRAPQAVILVPNDQEVQPVDVAVPAIDRSAPPAALVPVTSAAPPSAIRTIRNRRGCCTTGTCICRTRGSPEASRTRRRSSLHKTSHSKQRPHRIRHTGSTTGREGRRGDSGYLGGGDRDRRRESCRRRKLLVAGP
jgi:hypothetical protein